MSTIKPAIQLLEAGNRRIERSAKLFRNNGNAIIAHTIEKKIAEMEILIARVKEACRNDQGR